ncbi:tRNA1(Val) (adenine(37)-N6)-methyltransferase [Bauldia litoralis]|uniref:tRNA1(Val) A37 N6-methylase TrmN6 n=1 Tax=Bauldia litoralis TaxID=665467 RepID=A0A1G6C882_9HYPH|nr:methyltransferase [Bauldia litoralis]SDB29014.1 tRNA1(Val) A37 N6-methylase TrmN6 [Bauldia litoralis]
MTAATEIAPGITVDSFLDGRVEALQHARGHHRAGLEAVLLAVSLDSRLTGTVADLGAGVGVAGFCAAARCPHARVVLVERNAEAVACARQALTRPANAAFADRVRIAATDITAPEAERTAAGMGRDLADHVLLNPPFYPEAAGSRSPNPARADAHVLDVGGLDSWLRAAASVLKVRGDVTVIFRADGLAQLLAAIGRRFGALDILPIQPRAGEPAHRVLVRGLKGAGGPLRILPALVLHGDTGNGFTPEVEAMLRQGRALSLVVRAWHGGRGAPSRVDSHEDSGA